MAYFCWKSGNVIIIAKINDKSDNFKGDFSFSYICDIVTYSLKTDV